MSKEYEHLLSLLGVSTHQEAAAEIGRLHALAQPAQGEAVAWYWEKDGKPVDSEIWRKLPDAEAIKSAEEIGWEPHYLYDAPPATVPLAEHAMLMAELADTLARLAQYEGATVLARLAPQPVSVPEGYVDIRNLPDVEV